MPILGCIADDFTGGTDVAAALRRAGLSVALMFGIPSVDADPAPVDAVVVALKTRTVDAASAVEESLGALRWLQARGVERFYFKYCSTFDSTDSGNIGPVADAMLAELGEASTLVCPASPRHGRTMYQGHLFVGDQLLSESSMRHHPLTPMTDANIVRVLQRQTESDVGLLPLPSLREGPDQVAATVRHLTSRHARHIVVDAITEDDLSIVAEGASDLRLFTGGAGLAGAFGAALGAASGVLPAHTATAPDGSSIVLAGSCSAATLGQVAAAASVMPSYRLDPAATPDPDDMLVGAITWLKQNVHRAPVMIYSSAGPAARDLALAAMGPRTPDILERTLGALAQEAVHLGARRVIVAGGETSGAVVQALGISSVIIDSEADAGVPWCLTTDTPPLMLLLKSGNFGSDDLLVRATEGGGR